MAQIKPGLPPGIELESNHEPLYKRLPSRDENGNFLGDFMMLIPGTRQLAGPQFQSMLSTIHAVLEDDDNVVFADLNVRLNLLWVSVRICPGVIDRLSAEIRQRIPQARLVGHPVFGNSAANTIGRAIENEHGK